MPPLALKNLFFDLDGTLVNTERGILRAYRLAIEEAGYPAQSEEELRWVLGTPLRDNFPRIFQTKSSELIEHGVRLYRQHYESGAMYDFDVYPGIETLVAGLNECGFRLFVLTSKPVAFAVPILQLLPMHTHFQRIYGPELDGRFDDKTELLKSVLVDEQLVASECVVIGDRDRDIAAGKAAGTQTIGVTWGSGTEAELSAADYIVHSVSGLAEVLIPERPFTE